MIKRIFPFILSVVAFTISSCVDSSSDSYEIDEEWMLRNEREFFKLAADPEFNVIYGIVDPGRYILWKESDYWASSQAYNDDEAILPAVSPEFNDTVRCRYHAYYLDNTGEKVVFDSTEERTAFSTADPNKVGKNFAVNTLIDGWRVALYHMKEGDEWFIVIPYPLSYGMYQYGYIPGCTTLYFHMMLEKVTKLKS